MYRILSVILFLTWACIATDAFGHEGHDHNSPSGHWPAHSPSDPNAGGVARMGVPVAATVWKQSDGSTGNSPNSAINTNVETTLADVNTVAFDPDYVYIRSSGIPSHSIGPFGDGNPTIPGDQDATFRVSLQPTPAAVPVTTALSNIGVAVNGSGIYNWSDATYWDANTNSITNGGPGGGQAQDWNTNALWYRADGLDDAGGHPSGGPGAPITGGTYHYHQDPYGLEAQIDPNNNGESHSPIIGYAFDGYPIYGPYAYANGTDASDGFQQMTSSYQLIDARPSDGPAESDFELGSFAEDFEYVAGSGTLNEFNMEFVVTPEYPDGTWAYFTTYDLNGSGTALDGDVAFPFTVGPQYYGEVDALMVTPNAVVNVPDDVTFYFQYVPEPSPVLLLVLGLVATCLRHRRRR